MKLTLKLILCCAGLLSAASAFAQGRTYEPVAMEAPLFMGSMPCVENGVSYGILQGAGK